MQPTRRLKTYQGQTGYVYEYYFVGSRSAIDGGAATEYIFDVTADRKNMFAVTVRVEAAALAKWAAEHGRELSQTERYATAKMRLFQAFDSLESMMNEGRELSVTVENIGEVLSPLDIT